MYEWLKALHLIAAIAWMAGLFYLPRLFVYHCAAAPGSELSATFKVMERRLLYAIMTPAMIVTWVLGLWLAVSGGWLGAPWFQAKFLFLVALTIVHIMDNRWTREFAHDQNRRSHKFYRIVNEIPTILLIGIVILAVVKPL